MKADKVIVATGGMYYQTTGSTGDGYDFARKAGHKVTKLTPALVPFEIKEDYCKQLMGLSLRNVAVKMTAEWQKDLRRFWRNALYAFWNQWTSCFKCKQLYWKISRKRIKFIIDLKPALNKEH